MTQVICLSELSLASSLPLAHTFLFPQFFFSSGSVSPSMFPTHGIQKKHHRKSCLAGAPCAVKSGDHLMEGEGKKKQNKKKKHNNKIAVGMHTADSFVLKV